MRVAVSLARCVPGVAAVLLGCIAVRADAPAWRRLSIDGYYVRWLRAADAQGSTNLTWRVVERDEAYAGAINCERMTSPGELLADSRLTEGAFRTELRAAFDLWQRAARVTFSEAPSGQSADIVIGAQLNPAGRAFADVAYDKAGGGTERAIVRSLICLNPRVPWKIGYDGNLNAYDLRFTLAHEIGHAIGLDHPSRRGAIMWFRYDETITKLQRLDIDAAIALYGAHRLKPHELTGEPQQSSRGDLVRSRSH